ncbi:MAG: MTH938/NDUFAF3 family protein [Hadesarchaea archaeon]|nr:MTH938/NDUFAF3 family protein [Hadesarchaea archaeon]
MKVVRIDGTSFGSITVDGKRYPHDVWVFADGSIRRRDRDHEFTLDEFDLLLDGKPEVVVVGTGQSGCVRIGEDAAREAGRRGVKIISDVTPNALKQYNEAVRAKRKVAGAFHTTC